MDLQREYYEKLRQAKSKSVPEIIESLGPIRVKMARDDSIPVRIHQDLGKLLFALQDLEGDSQIPYTYDSLIFQLTERGILPMSFRDRMED